MYAILLSIFLSSLLLSKNFSTTLTPQGFTGVINTPNAQILNEGTLSFLYSNQKDNHLRYYNYSNSMKEQENFLIGIGFLPNIEITAKLMVGQKTLGDLSGNIKLLLPSINQNFPNIAIGWQDLGGALSLFGNRYIVLDKEIGFLRASLGYGDSLNTVGKSRMDGFFWGLEAEITEGIFLMGEDDGEENHMAVRLKAPKKWFNNFDLEAKIIQNLTESETSFVVNLNIPLTYSSTNNRGIKESLNKKRPFVNNRKDMQKRQDSYSYEIIKNRLISIGFENIQVGEHENSIYVQVENNIFTHNDLDALGVILGILVENNQDKKHFIITLLQNNIQTLTMSGEIESCRNYFYTPSVSSEDSFRRSLHFTRTFDKKNVKFMTKKEKSTLFIPRLELSPDLTTTIGTEVGLFDYLVGLRTNVYIDLAQGMTFSSRYEIPLFNSKNFNDGYLFSKMYKDKLKSHLINSILEKTIYYDTFLNTTSIGLFQRNYFGILNHLNFTTISGEHGFNIEVGSFKNKSAKENSRHDIYMGAYRYFYAPLDLFTEFSYGKYWNQDSGGMFKLQRFFGDTSVSFYLKDSIKTYAGFEVSLPLSYRKSLKPFSFGQIKGKKDFSYGIRTVVKSPDSANYLNPTGGIVLKSDLDLTSRYLNRDRLSSSYIKRHLNRMREAFFLYGQK